MQMRWIKNYGWLAALSLGVAVGAETTDGKHFTQVPEIAPGSAAEVSPTTTSTAKDKILAGPVPQWVWGPDDNGTYLLRTRFMGGSAAAWLSASCDNIVTVTLNGKKIGTSDDWHAPVSVDIQQALKPGMNELVAEVRNEGGPAAFVCKVALVDQDGTTRYVLSDDTWHAATKSAPDQAVALRTVGKLGDQPWGNVFAVAATGGTRDTFNLLPGFVVEKLFTVPKEELGSWVNIAFDPQGRLIASDQDGKGLCRITVPALGSTEPTKVEHLDLKITAAQGILFAFDSMYLSVNGGPGSGLYRVRDTNNDDQYDEVTKLSEFRGGGEHGPHALRLSPDGKSIWAIAGNHTHPPASIHDSRLPTNWDEDHLLPRQWDANGHARGVLAPGGWVAQVDPEGKTWDILSIGYRNPFDMALNADQELFVYDADMEWDYGTPWYRPTRVTHATSGSEFGWRSGTGKWPNHYPDSLPQVVDIGPGSPVGVTFGYGAKFPAKYQKALYLCDWTFGTMYAIHITPQGSSYVGRKEEFVSRTPLPLTDAVVGPDGAMYFTIGGRGTQSELFRVTYRGTESTEPAELKDAAGAELRALRHLLEAHHGAAGKANPETTLHHAWPALSHADRFIRYAARVALEVVPTDLWIEKLAAEKNPSTIIQASIALARQGKPDTQPQVLAALGRLDFAQLPEGLQLDALRAWSLTFLRQGAPTAEVATALAEKLDPFYPAQSDSLNRELCNVLVYLQSPTVATKTLALLAAPSQPPTAEQAAAAAELLARNPGYGGTVAAVLANQIDVQKLHYAFALRNLKTHWTIDQRQAYFAWMKDAHKYSGGASFQGFLRNIEQEAFDNATDTERLVLEASGAREPYKAPELPKPTGPGQEWTVEQLLQLSQTKLKARNFENGKKMFAAARCVICHRFAGEGGATGPDLSQAAGRFGAKDMLDAIIEPSKVVSDQYRAFTVVTTAGQSYTGRLVADRGDKLAILTDPENSTKLVEIPKSEVEEQLPSKTSIMPQGLLKTLNEDEALDLLAYLLSRGNPQDKFFQK